LNLKKSNHRGKASPQAKSVKIGVRVYDPLSRPTGKPLKKRMEEKRIKTLSRAKRNEREENFAIGAPQGKKPKGGALWEKGFHGRGGKITRRKS